MTDILKQRNHSKLEKIRILNGAHLKWIAMASMFIDHFNKGVILDLIIFKDCTNSTILFLNDFLSILGRIAFPIFLFLLVEGFFHTHNRWKYFASLLGFAFIAEVPYDMFSSTQYWDKGGQNIYFTLALALLTIWIIDKIRAKITKYWIIPTIPITLICGFLASSLGLDYHYYGIFIPVVLYICHTKRILGSVLSYLIVIKELWSFTGFIAINLYNGERGKINKWFCYWFYPVHLLLIGIIRMFVIQG